MQASRKEGSGFGLKQFRNLDLFGLRMEWTVNGAQKFKTYVGAVLTVVIGTIILAFGIRKFIEMYTVSNPDIKSFPLKINLTDPKNPYSYQPTSSNFNIAFGFTDGRVLTPNIGSFEAIYTT